MEYTFLSGGTGTPKLLQGFRTQLEDKYISILCNSGDDLNWYGLRVCPDMDTVLYLMADKLDTVKFWGIQGDTFNTLYGLGSLGEDTWFGIGDQDLSLHILRSEMMRSMRLTEVMKTIALQWGVSSRIVPMSDDLLQTRIHSSNDNYSFQEYFVKMRTKIEVTDVTFDGNDDSTPPEALELLDNDHIIIGPSNPVTSIGPILAMGGIEKKLSERRSKTVAISPLSGGMAFSGPTVSLMKAIGMEPSVKGLADYYESYISKMIIDSSDTKYIAYLEDKEIEAIILPISLGTDNQKNQLAMEILNIL